MRAISTDDQPTGQIPVGKRSKLRFLFPLALIFTAALIACTSNADNGSSGVGSLNDGGSSNSGDSAPDFPVTMYQGQDAVGGRQVNFSDLVGQTPVVLNFWAGLCPPCRAEMPDLQEFNNKFEDRVLLLGIDIGQFTGLGSQEDAIDLLQELGVTYPAGFTTDAEVVRNYKVLGMPTTVFIDGEGKIFNKWTGALNLEVLEEKTLEMLNQ